MSRLLDNSKEYRDELLSKNQSLEIDNSPYNEDDFRKRLLSKNIYTPRDEYDIDNPKILDAISSFGLNSYINTTALSKVTNTIDKLYSRINNPTPIVKFGMMKLADQFLKTVTSNASREISEAVDLSNIFKKGKSIFTGLDYKITKPSNENKLSSIGNLIKNLTGITSNKELLSKDLSDIELIKQSGTGQTNQLIINVSRNRYINSNFYNRIITDNDKLEKLTNKSYIQNKIYFDPNNKYFPDAIFGNEEMFIQDNLSNYVEYDSNGTQFIKEFGDINTSRKTDNLEDTNYGFRDDITNNIIWGIDGTKERVDSSKYGNDDVGNDRISDVQPNSLEYNFGVRHGLLKYTSEIINSSKNSLIDITRKKFYDPINRDRFIGKNGSGVYDVPDELLSQNENLYHGIRQHTMIDQYDRNAKLIRFNGNSIYGGSENSVINDSVKPRIFPTLNDDGTFNNKNLMFSIENLAVKVIKDIPNNLCYMDDENGTTLPLSEAGNFNGRLMWFPPYDIQLREDVSNKITSTDFIGRGEPVYTYDNTERTINLSFKLLIDHPPQLNNIPRQDFHKRVSEFFVFGGEGEYGMFNDLDKLKKQLELTIAELEPLKEVELNHDTPFSDQKISIFFDNDEDAINQTYENGIPDDGEENDFGLNVGKKLNDEVTVEDGFDFKITKLIEEYLTEENKGLIEIDVIGFASKLYYDEKKESNYNKQLSERRVKNVVGYLKSKYGSTLDNDFKIYKIYEGSDKSEQPNDASIIDSLSVKEERRVDIIIRKSKTSNTKTITLTPEQRKRKNILLNQKDSLNAKISELNQKIKQFNGNTFIEYKIEDNFMRGFEGVEKFKFQPCFYSQTPEDFHRRLTFLQQCMRQGKSVDSDELNSNNSVFGRQPISILRIGDFFHTKVIFEGMSLDYSMDFPWDLNPEGMGVQPMIADVTLRLKVIGGQSLATPIAKLQNALSFNYYANSTFYNRGTYSTPYNVEVEQLKINEDLLKKDEK